MTLSIAKKPPFALAVAAGALLCLLSAVAPLASAQQGLNTALPDTAVESGVLGEPQYVEADVGTGAAPLADIRLFYRFDGMTGYESLPMRPSGRAGVYAASVPTAGIDARQMEFYILAEEVGGGTLAKGSAFAPLVRALTPSPSTSASPGTNADGRTATGTVPDTGPDTGASPVGGVPEPKVSSGGRKYLYYALGILAVGALAAASSGGGGGGGGDLGPSGCGDEGCNLTLTLPAP